MDNGNYALVKLAGKFECFRIPIGTMNKAARIFTVALGFLAWNSRPGHVETWLGANGHSLASYLRVSAERQMDYLADLVLKSYRVDFRSEEQAGQLGHLVALGKARGKKPIWLSDFNYTGGRIDGEEKLALGLREMAIRLRKLSGAYNVEAAHIDELIGETYWGDHFEARMDLVKLVSDGSEEWRTGAPKSANHTMRELTGAIGSFRFTRQPSLEAADKAAVTVAERECLTERLDERVEAQNRSLMAYVYCRINGRQPDATDLHAHTRSIRGGTSIDSVILDWMGSDEFRNRLATLNDEFAVYVAAMYRLMLDGADGFQSYVLSLDRGTITSKNCSPPTS